MVEKEQNRQPRYAARRKIVLQIVLALIILSSGTIIGAGATILLEKNGIISIRSRYRPESAELAQKFQRKYGLNDEQTQQVEEIFSESLQYREAIREQMIEQLRKERERLVEKMREILTDEQFDQWHEDFQAGIERIRRRHEKR